MGKQGGNMESNQSIFISMDNKLAQILNEIRAMREEAIVPLMHNYAGHAKNNHENAKETIGKLDKISVQLSTVTSDGYLQAIQDIQHSKTMDYVYRRKDAIRKLWTDKLNQLKNAYENLTRNRNKSRIFAEWVENELFLPKKYRQKINENASEEQREASHKLGFSKMKEDVARMKESEEKFRAKCTELNSYMCELIKRRETTNISSQMLKIWDQEVETMKKKIRNEWEKKELFWKNLPHSDNPDQDDPDNFVKVQKPKPQHQNRFPTQRWSNRQHSPSYSHIVQPRNNQPSNGMHLQRHGTISHQPPFNVGRNQNNKLRKPMRQYSNATNQQRRFRPQHRPQSPYMHRPAPPPMYTGEHPSSSRFSTGSQRFTREQHQNRQPRQLQPNRQHAQHNICDEQYAQPNLHDEYQRHYHYDNRQPRNYRSRHFLG